MAEKADLKRRMMQAGLRFGNYRSASAPMFNAPSRFRAAVREGLRAAKANLLPGSILIACGAALVVSYYQVEPVQGLLNVVGHWKDRLGLLFAVLSTAFFGGVLPLVFRRLFLGQGCSRADILFQTLFWAEKGVEVDLLYRAQAHVFGHAVTWQNVLPKVLIDQFIYVPLIAVPTMTLGYLWKDCGYGFKRAKDALRRRGFLERSLPVLISNWAVWIPVAVAIYCFPLPLQVPLMNITLTIWVMLLMLLAADKEQ